MAMLDLLNDQRLWATWGPPLRHEPRWLTDKIVKLVADRVDLPFDTVAEMLLGAPAQHRYIVLRQLAATGHSVVYAGVDRVLAREVAIKIHQNEGEYASHRVMVEARALSGADHPNIVQIHDVGEQDDWLFSVTELCDDDLQSWCVSADWSDILARIIEVGAGLGHLHAIGTVHGDVKPLNILIKRGTARLADFGNASQPGASLQLGGTPGYVAPEVALGERTASSDVFALAVTTWACLFGVLPFGELRGDARTAITLGIQRTNDGAFVPPRLIPRGMPREIIKLLERALHHDPAQRPSLNELLRGLREARAIGEGRRSFLRRLPRVLAGAGVGLSGIAVIAAFVVPGTCPPPGWVNDAISRWTVESAVAVATRGDAGWALQTLEHATFVHRDDQESRKLAVASELVAIALEEHGLVDDATLAWTFAVRFARDADDRDLEERSIARMRESLSATVPQYRSR